MKRVLFAAMALLPGVAAAQSANYIGTQANCTFGCPAPTLVSMSTSSQAPCTFGCQTPAPTSAAGIGDAMIDLNTITQSALIAYSASLQPEKPIQLTQNWLNQYYQNIILNWPAAPAANILLSTPVQNTTPTETAMTQAFTQSAAAIGSVTIPAPDQNATGINEALASVSPTAAVPEPASWTMMILGLGLMGFALRRHAVDRRALATVLAGR